MGKVVIAVYRPREGKAAQLLEVVREHLPILRAEGLVTDRPSVAMRAKDGTIVEVFEWKSQEAIEEAHNNEVVREMWERFDQTCECKSLSNLEECQDLFPLFEPVEI
ncbi:MAG: antibiotic biosynthesis monooxygenase [Planctomycetota bacterium]|jgi:quinol monooxygenase YgiN